MESVAQTYYMCSLFRQIALIRELQIEMNSMGAVIKTFTAPRSTQRPHRQGGARLHLHHAVQRQLQCAGKTSD